MGEMGADGTRSRDDRTTFDRFKKSEMALMIEFYCVTSQCMHWQSFYYLMPPRFKLGVQRTLASWLSATFSQCLYLYSLPL